MTNRTERPTHAEVAAALEGGTPAIVCYAKCEPCQWGQHYEIPAAHPWAGPEDIEHAASTGQPKPTGNCSCPCARPADEGAGR